MKKILPGMFCLFWFFIANPILHAAIIDFEDFTPGSYNGYAYNGYFFELFEVVELNGNKVAKIGSDWGQGIIIERMDGGMFNAGNFDIEGIDDYGTPQTAFFILSFFAGQEIPGNYKDDDEDGTVDEGDIEHGYFTDGSAGFQSFSGSSQNDYKYLAFMTFYNQDTIYVDNIELPSVPVPGTFFLLGSGLIGIFGLKRARKFKA